MRLITRPAWAASLRQRCTSFSNSSSSAESFFNGWRSMPGTSPATSQFDWLISMTAISVLSWSKAVRDRLRSFDCGMGHSTPSDCSTAPKVTCPRRSPHTIFHEAVRGRPMADGQPFGRSYTWTKSVLQQRGLVTKAPKRSAHRKKRARRPLPGMLVFQDGSKHVWLPQGPELDLIVTMDDATSAILSAVLVEEEGTASSFVGLKEGTAAHALFCALYPARGSHYFPPPKAGEPVDKTRLTQIGRALKQLGIEHIPSYCPEGRGRMERLFGTLQSRLPPLMRQEGLASIEAANRWLATVYIPHHNTRFAVAPAEE